ncbi:MAG: dolichyl-diphosphooligosaccharide--protein glycosyltransferase subunit 1 [Candidatus Methanomethylicia archaeon]|nr:dolichyl-diphosphooligosaccharide--protein glycosyltransferase subunit 1 [Candidatus Methanomethylicia archaeon]
MNLKFKWTLLIIVLILMLETIVIKVQSETTISTVNRTIYMEDNYALIIDELNIARSELNVTQYIPKRYSYKLFMVKAYDEYGERKLVFEEEEEYIKIVLIGEVKGQVKFEFYIIMHLNIIADKFTFEYPLYPILNIIMDKCRTIVYYPKGKIEVSIVIPYANITKGERVKVEYIQEPLPPNTYIELFTAFKADITSIIIEKITRRITLNQDIEVEDTIQILNPIMKKISRDIGIKLVMLKNVKLKYVSDVLGRINHKVNYTEDYTYLTVYPRIDISGGWTYEFTIKYTIPKTDYVTVVQQEILNLPINTILETPIKQLYTITKFLEGTKIVTYTGNPTTIGESKIEYEIKNLICKEIIKEPIKITYTPGSKPIQIPTTQLAYAIIILLTVSTTYLKYKSTRKIEKVKIDYVKILHGAYLEKMNEYIKIKDLIGRYGSGEIDRKEYLNNKNKIMVKIEELNKKIENAKMKIESEIVKGKITELNFEMGRLVDLISKIEDLENKRIHKTIKRTEYLRIKDSNERIYNRTIRKIEAKINELIELRV